MKQKYTQTKLQLHAKQQNHHEKSNKQDGGTTKHHLHTKNEKTIRNLANTCGS